MGRSEKFVFRTVFRTIPFTVLCTPSVVGVPFDELAMDKERDGLYPEVMMLSRISDSGSICQYYLDEESLNGDGCAEYLDLFHSVFGFVQAFEH